MLRIPIAIAFAGATTLAACGDDPVKPGELVIAWNTGPSEATCTDLAVTSLQARVMKGDEQIASASGACAPTAKSGSIAIPDLTPGTYKVELDGVDAAGDATFYGEIAKQSVKEGKTVETAVIGLSPKPGEVAVNWLLPDGATRCAVAKIEDVEFSLYYRTTQLVAGPTKIDCNSVDFAFTDLLPDDAYKVIAYAYDSSKKKIAKGSTDFFPLKAGDELSKDIQLETCPGDPPVCQ